MRLIELLITMKNPEDVIYVEDDADAYNEYNPLPNEYLHMDVAAWDYCQGASGNILTVRLTDTPFRCICMEAEQYDRILGRAIDMKTSISRYLDWALERLYAPLTVMDILDILPGYTVKLQRGNDMHHSDWAHLPDDWCDIPIDVMEVDKHGYLTIKLEGERNGEEDACESKAGRPVPGHMAQLLYPERPVRVPQEAGEKGEPAPGAPGAGKERDNRRAPFWHRRK